jgi:hypothetical protein
MSDEWLRIKRRDIAYKLRRRGVPLEIPEPHEVPRLIIRQQGSLTENCAFDLDCGGTGFIINLYILINKFKTAIDYFELDVPWRDATIRWLDDPVSIGALFNVYRFPGTGALEFGRESVINHMAGSTRTWSKGQCVQGLLLGFGSDSISNDFRHGSNIPAFIRVVDQFRTPYNLSISLWTDRSTNVSKALKNKPRRKLFESADVRPAHLTARDTSR